MTDNEISTFGSTIAPPSQVLKPGAHPGFMIGTDDKPMDNRIVAVSLGVRAEMKVGDRTFSAPVLLHEVTVLRHYYEMRAGSCQVRITAAWVPGLDRTRKLTHQELSDEVKRLRETFVVAKQGGQVIKSFELFYGTDPATQLKKLHEVMKKQHEAWNDLAAKAMTRLPVDTATLHPKVRESMASELITDRELEEIVALADPSRSGLEEIELAEIKSIDIDVAPKVVDLDAVKAEAEKDEIVDSEIEALLDKLTSGGLNSQNAQAVATLFSTHDKVTDEDLIRAVGGSKTKAEQVRKLLS